MTQIKLLHPKEGVTIAAIKVDPDEYDFSLNYNSSGLLSQNDESEAPFPHVYWLPQGPWQILGLSDQLSEEQWRELVHKQSTFGDYYYVANNRSFDTATEAGLSFLEANGVYSKNPLGDEPEMKYKNTSCENDIVDYRYDYYQWEQAQANTGSWLILKRV
jgi:hypothetical protein